MAKVKSETTLQDKLASVKDYDTAKHSPLTSDAHGIEWLGGEGSYKNYRGVESMPCHSGEAVLQLSWSQKPALRPKRVGRHMCKSKD